MELAQLLTLVSLIVCGAAFMLILIVGIIAYRSRIEIEKHEKRITFVETILKRIIDEATKRKQAAAEATAKDQDAKQDLGPGKKLEAEGDK